MAHYDMLVIGSHPVAKKAIQATKTGKESPAISMVARNEEIGVALYVRSPAARSSETILIIPCG